MMKTSDEEMTSKLPRHLSEFRVAAPASLVDSFLRSIRNDREGGGAADKKEDNPA
ncbi:MAG: hypothetical protein FWG47_07075 [Propionibacteriaceae bacterium]|nr:hypothetical protein [Propionibacteriaceae bacterium]